jgi:general secretion pathway protein D
MLDVGTANALSLRLINKAATAGSSGAPAASQPTAVPQGQSPQSMSSPNQAPNQVLPIPTPATQAGGGTFLFDPPTMNQAKGSTFTVNVMVSGGQNMHSVPVQLSYDPNQLQVVNVSNGGFLSQDGQAVGLVHKDDPVTGTLQVTATRPPGAGGVSGQGAVLTITFMAKGPGQSALTITRGGARDPAMQPIAMSGAQAAITIQ